MQDKKYIYILLLIFALVSCEKIIQVDLNDAEPRIVVEGQITNEAGLNLVSLSKTSSFYSTDTITRIVGATVSVSDDDGNTFILDEIAPGFYNNKIMKTDRYQSYKLHVDTGFEIIEAYSTTPSEVKIDSMKIELNKFGPGSGGGGDGDGNSHYTVYAYFMDLPNEVNFYRLRLVVNQVYMSGFYVVDDRVFDGKTIPYAFGGIALEEDDKVWVELLGIDEANFNYFYTLQRLQGNGQDITPGNPPTNLHGDAIGIFGASTFDKMSMVFHVEE